ncbi:MAG: FAD-binding oxidoreductase [Rhodospirillaceae bacterium]|nr:FAD-binding oxidoreductase [Rhodospirillaceae bacterium]
MSPEVDPVDADETLPQRVNVVVIGGGIIGSCAAYYLAKTGLSVALCEKGVIGGEQSSRNWGWCRQTRRDPREIALAIESLRLWGGLNAEIEDDTGFRRAGIVFACSTDEEVASHEAWLEHARPYQIDARMVSGADLDALLPGSTVRYKAAIHTVSDGRAEPSMAAPAVARAARRLGAAVLTGCAVRELDLAGGKVAGVLTEKGRIACDSVILAGGAWSRLFCDGLGLRLPQLKLIATVMRTTPLDGPPDHGLWTNKFAFRKRLDGGYSVATSGTNTTELRPDSFRFFFDFLPAVRMEWKSLRPRIGRSFLDDLRTPRRPVPGRPSAYEQTRILDPDPSDATNRRTKADLDAAFPAFKQARIARQWAGSIDVTPDAVPVISPVHAVPGFFIATGFSGHGFGVGPAAGRLAADLVTGAPPLVDPAPFRFQRFTDGSRPRPYAGI